MRPLSTTKLLPLNSPWKLKKVKNSLKSQSLCVFQASHLNLKCLWSQWSSTSVREFLVKGLSQDQEMGNYCILHFCLITKILFTLLSYFDTKYLEKSKKAPRSKPILYRPWKEAYFPRFCPRTWFRPSNPFKQKSAQWMKKMRSFWYILKLISVALFWIY